MKLYLYQNISDEKKVGKSLSLVETITAVKWKEDTDILHPVFTFHKFKDAQGNMIWKDFNYCALEWNDMPTRYYFIKNFRVNLGGVIELRCDIDVRETWKDWILNNKFLVSRQQKIKNVIMQDNRLPVPQTRAVYSKEIGTVGDGGDGTIILTVSG